jgi:hypothetical protein
MTIGDAVDRLGPTLARDSAGRYTFACKKAFVLVKLYGHPARFRFRARDQVVFRLTGDRLTIEKQATGAVQRSFAWDEIECICAGEPEKDDGTLFQG